MSSDEEFQWEGDSDEEYEYPIEDDDDPPEVAAPAPRVQRYQPPPAPLAGPGPAARGFAQQAMAMHPGAFQAGFGGHAFARPPAGAFRKQYKAFSTAILEVQQGRSFSGGRSNLMFGGKIVMPPSALNEITQLDIELPLDFEITNPAFPDLNTHCGVLEFIADEGTVNLPQWIMDQLRLNEGDPIRIWGVRAPKGKMVKMQPQSVDFLEISDAKSVLENALRNFSVLSAGDIIEIGYQSLTFRILIMEITPPGPAISVLDTDLEVDFAPPLGYVEPDYNALRAPAPTMKDKFVINTEGKQDVDARGSGTNTPNPGSGGRATPVAGGSGGGWDAFKGSGASLSGKRIKGKGAAVRKIENVDPTSKIIRTGQPRIITADTQIGGRQVPAALNLPFGNLFFGYANLGPPPGSDEEKAAQAAVSAPVQPFASVGNGNTLSGRMRAGPPAAPAGAPPSASAPARAQAQSQSAGGEAKPAVPFSGQGNSLSGGAMTKRKKPSKEPDIIID